MLSARGRRRRRIHALLSGLLVTVPLLQPAVEDEGAGHESEWGRGTVSWCRSIWSLGT